MSYLTAGVQCILERMMIMVMMIGSDDGDLVNDQDCLRPEDQDNEVKTSFYQILKYPLQSTFL